MMDTDAATEALEDAVWRALEVGLDADDILYLVNAAIRDAKDGK
jgi:hypothetical protein